MADGEPDLKVERYTLTLANAVNMLVSVGSVFVAVAPEPGSRTFILSCIAVVLGLVALILFVVGEWRKNEGEGLRQVGALLFVLAAIFQAILEAWKNAEDSGENTP